MSRTITKVKVKAEGVEIRYSEKAGKVDKEVVFKCTEEPNPEFSLAMAQLVADVYSILELEADWCPQRMKITGVSFSMSEETGVEGAVITGQVELETANAPFCFNTPHIPFDQYSEGGTAPIMPESTIRNLEVVRTEALRYIEGKRAQLELSGV